MRRLVNLPALLRVYIIFGLVAGLLFGTCVPTAVAQPTATPDASAAAPAGDPAATTPATPAVVSEIVSATFSDSPIERVLSQLATKSGKTILARGKTAGQRVSLVVRNVQIERALDQITFPKNWIWIKSEDQPNTYEIWDQESFKVEVLPRQVRQKVFVPREISAEEAFKAVQGVLTPNIGAASADPRSNKLIVTDLPPVLELVQRLLDQIDVKFITRVFYIRNADVNSIAEKLTNLKSASAPAPEVDQRTRQIIVRDRYEIIRQMELIVQQLDIGPEIRVYELNNVEFEGNGEQAIRDALERVLTPDAYFQINIQAGKLIVEDVPEVHEKIEKILQAFDQPAKQVVIESEIVETVFQEGFEYNIDYAYSKDLLSAAADGLTGDVIPTGPGTISNNLGFLNLKESFPYAVGGGTLGGIDTANLTKNAFFRLKAAMSDTRTRILQQPRVQVKNQKQVTLSVGQKLAYFSGSGYTDNDGNNNSGNSVGQVQFAEVGLILEIKPTIGNNGMVEMEVFIQNNSGTIVTRLFDGRANEVPDIRNQEIETVLIIPSGETRVIGGLITEGKSETKKGIPGLYKLPYIGPALFGGVSRPADSNGRRNLLIFLTPTIVEERPRDVKRYQGRPVLDLAQADDLTTPADTLVDLQLEPMALPNAVLPPPPMPSKDDMFPPDTRPSNRVLDRDFTIEAPTDPNQTPGDVPQGELMELRRSKIDDAAKPEGALGAALLPLRGPSGIVGSDGPGTAGGVRTGTATGVPGRVPGAPGVPVNAGQPPVPPRIVSTPFPTPPTSNPGVRETRF